MVDIVRPHPQNLSNQNKAGISSLNIEDIITRVKQEENLEVSLKNNYPEKIGPQARYKHDSIPRLLELAYGITQISLGKEYTTNDRVRNVLDIDMTALLGDINYFLSYNRQPQYRVVLNRIGKVLESILAIHNNGDIVNWNLVFKRLEKAA